MANNPITTKKVSFSETTNTVYIHFSNGSKQAYDISYFDSFYAGDQQ